MNGCVISPEFIFSKHEIPFEIKEMSELKGRGGLATRDIKEGETILTENPILIHQEVENMGQSLCCNRCFAPIGTLEMQYDLLVGLLRLSDLKQTDWLLTDHRLGPITSSCLQGCGVSYCSEKCRDLANSDDGHFLTCAGRCETIEHPLIKFKQHALSECSYLYAAAKVITKIISRVENHGESLQDAMDRFFILQHRPWWEVYQKKPDFQGSDEEWQDEVRNTLSDSLELLKAALGDIVNIEKFESILNLKFYSELLGMFHQNEIGIHRDSSWKLYLKSLKQSERLWDNELRNLVSVVVDMLTAELEGAEEALGSGDESDGEAESGDEEKVLLKQTQDASAEDDKEVQEITNDPAEKEELIQWIQISNLPQDFITEHLIATFDEKYEIRLVYVGPDFCVLEIHEWKSFVDWKSFVECFNNSSYLDVALFEQPSLEDGTILQVLNLPENATPEIILRHLKLPEAYVLEFDGVSLALELSQSNAADILSTEWPPLGGSDLQFEEGDAVVNLETLEGFLADEDMVGQIFPPFDGCALCSIACRFNHSLEPNIGLSFESEHAFSPLRLTVKALKPIANGEELCFNYLPPDCDDPERNLLEYGIITPDADQ